MQFDTPGLAQRVQTLVERMDEHVRLKTDFDPSLPPHVELTEALHRMAFGEEQEGLLQVRYADSTKGEPFPVGSLWQPEPPAKWDAVLMLGTLSFRHLSYDSHVDLYLIRDRETKGLPQNAVEKLAAKRMTEVLNSRAMAQGGCITLHQTGLEPLVMGVYGAIVRFFIERSTRDEFPPVYIRPVYYLDDDRKASASLWGQA